MTNDTRTSQPKTDKHLHDEKRPAIGVLDDLGKHGLQEQDPRIEIAHQDVPVEKVDPQSKQPTEDVVEDNKKAAKHEEKKEKREHKDKDPREEKEDRSAYNCEPCKGLGLQNERTICQACLGTGKVS